MQAAGMDVAEIVAEDDLTAENVQATLHYLDYLRMQEIKDLRHVVRRRPVCVAVRAVCDAGAAWNR